MADHFAVIGMRTGSDPDELGVLVDRALADASNVETLPLSSGGRTELWTDSSGAGVAVHFNAWNQVACGTPFFNAQRAVPVVIDVRIPDGSCSFCDRLNFHIFDLNEMQRAGENGTEAAYPLAAQVADVGLVAKTIAEPATGFARLSFFAEKLQVWPSEAAYRASQPANDAPIATRSLIPSGLFSSPKQALVMMTGEVIGVSTRINQLTGQTFHVLEIATYAATFEAVVANDLCPLEGIAGGNIVQGQFWVVCPRIATDIPNLCG